MKRFILVLAALIMAGCATIPNGYDADTTPDHNGEEWVGGR